MCASPGVVVPAMTALNFPLPLITDSKNAPITIQLKRDNSPELLTKAEAFFKAGQNSEARAEYMQVLEAHPDLTGINRAIAFLASEKAAYITGEVLRVNGGLYM